jgi:hypothetical protein
LGHLVRKGSVPRGPVSLNIPGNPEINASVPNITFEAMPLLLST